MTEKINTPESASSVFEQFGIPASPSFKEKTKPAAWNRRSKAPYYTLEYGRAMKEIADRMLQTRKDQRFELEHFPSLRINSLYSRVNQGIRYLLEEMDTPDKKYATWRAMILIRNEKDGIRLFFNPAFRECNFNAREVASRDDLSWKERVDNYLESEEKQPLVINNLSLTTEEALTLVTSLKGLANITFEVKKESIRIIKHLA